MSDVLDDTVTRIHRSTKQLQRDLPSTRRDRFWFITLVALLTILSMYVSILITRPAWAWMIQTFEGFFGKNVGQFVGAFLLLIGNGFLALCLTLILFWITQWLFPFAYRSYRDDQHSLGQPHPFEGE